MGGEDRDEGEPFPAGESSPFLRVLVRLFSRGKLTVLRTLWPIPGGFTFEQQFDEQGNLVSERTTGWVGLPPSRAGQAGGEIEA